MASLDFYQTAAWLLGRDNFLILTHVRPDGDTVGCAAGLCLALREQGKTAYILPDPNTSGLFTEYVQPLWASSDYAPDTVVAVDIAASQEFYAKDTCLDGARAACGELIYDIVRQWGPVSKPVAEALYMAVSTDCGCFVYSNTNAACHRVAADLLDTGIDCYPINRRHFRTKSFKRLKLESMLTEGMQLLDGGAVAIVTLTLDMIRSLQATEEDMDNISAFVGQIEGVRTGVTIRQLTDTACKISLRTDPDELNASKVCALLGGGGHAAASGATVEASPEQTADMVIQAIRTVQNA